MTHSLVSFQSIHFLVLMDGFWPLQHSVHTRHSNEKPLLIQKQCVLISINRSQVLCFLHEREHNLSTSTSLPLNDCQLPGEKQVMCDVDSGEVWTHAPESDAHDVLYLSETLFSYSQCHIFDGGVLNIVEIMGLQLSIFKKKACRKMIKSSEVIFYQCRIQEQIILLNQ